MGKKILIIDDNEIDLVIAKRRLEETGYNEILTAQDANEGVKKAMEEKPDLVILDTLLPGSSGFEICRQIREICGQVPKIIIITGSVDAVDAVMARKCGADDYCAKTSDCVPLIEAVKRLIQ
jgi:two-component system alkaline phosphatase synthesis response regulator PhoP